jgi:type IV pilus assembly protein PilA
VPGRLTQHIRAQRGFTLIEVLVVILVIAVLAALAIPMFVEKSVMAHDADAKSNARNLLSQVDSCFAIQEDFRDCDTEAKLGSNLGLAYGTSPGEVRVLSAQKLLYTVEAVSHGDSGGAAHTFTIQRDVRGNTVRTCTAGTSNDLGGCRNGVW